MTVARSSGWIERVFRLAPDDVRTQVGEDCGNVPPRKRRVDFLDDSQVAHFNRHGVALVTRQGTLAGASSSRRVNVQTILAVVALSFLVAWPATADVATSPDCHALRLMKRLATR